MVEMKCRLTAEHLKKMVEDTLRAFNCNINQVCSITTDNGANMVKCCSLLENEQDADHEDTDNETDNVDESEGSLDNTPITSMLRCVRCASHTLQVPTHSVNYKHSC